MYMVAMYDVQAKRTEKFRKLLRRYLIHTQYSVFCGDITEAQAVRLRRELGRIMIPGDRVTEISTANRQNIEVRHLEKSAQGEVAKKVDEDHKRDFKII